MNILSLREKRSTGSASKLDLARRLESNLDNIRIRYEQYKEKFGEVDDKLPNFPLLNYEVSKLNEAMYKLNGSVEERTFIKTELNNILPERYLSEIKKHLSELGDEDEGV